MTKAIVRISPEDPDIVQRRPSEPERLKNRHNLSRIVLSFFASDTEGNVSIILILLPILALVMLSRIIAVVIFTILDAQLSKSKANYQMIINSTENVEKIFYFSGNYFREKFLKYFSVSSLEYQFQPGNVLWTLYPTIILLIFATKCGKPSSGGNWIKLIMKIIELNDSSDNHINSVEGLDFESEIKLKKQFRIGLIANLAMVTFRGCLLLTLGLTFAKPVYVDPNGPLISLIWLTPQIIWIFYSSFLIVFSIYYVECISAYFVEAFEKINKMIKVIIDSADEDRNKVDRYHLLRTILKEHDRACSRIAEYNNFWSYYLLASYFILIPISGINLYQGIFTGRGSKAEQVMILISAVEAFIFISKISGLCASINKMAHSSYPLLIRVSFQEFPVELQIQLRLLIQRLSGPRIGFYCAALFEISRATFFAILVALGQNFFLVIQIAKPKHVNIKHD